jgi:hypothetical protein
LSLLGDQVGAGAVAGVEVVELARPGAGVVDQFGQVGDRQRWRHADEGAADAEHGDGREVGHDVERHLHQERQRHMGRHGEQRVAVRRGAGYGLARHHAVATRPRIDDERLAEFAQHDLGDGAGRHVDQSAGRSGQHDPDRLGGPGVGARGEGRGERGGERAAQQKPAG